MIPCVRIRIESEFNFHGIVCFRVLFICCPNVTCIHVRMYAAGNLFVVVVVVVISRKYLFRLNVSVQAWYVIRRARTRFSST